MFIYQQQFHIQIQITYQDEQVHKSWATQHFLIGNQLLIQGLMIQTWKNIKHHVKMTKMVCINQIWQSWPHVNLHTQMTYKRYSNAWEVSCNHAPHRGHMKVQTGCYVSWEYHVYCLPTQESPYFECTSIAQQNKQTQKYYRIENQGTDLFTKCPDRGSHKGERRCMNIASIWRILDFKLAETKQVLELGWVRTMYHKYSLCWVLGIVWFIYLFIHCLANLDIK